VFQSCSLGAPDGSAHLCAALGRIRKRAFTPTSVAQIVLAPILLATAGLIRLLTPKSVLVTDECVRSGGKPWGPPDRMSVLQITPGHLPGCLRRRLFEIWQSKRVLQC